MPRDSSYQLVDPLQDDNDNDIGNNSSRLQLGSRKSLLSSADMVIPLVCGICLHLFYITLLLPILVLYFNDYNDLQQCVHINFEIYLILALLIHIFTLITNLLSTVIAFQTKVLNTSKWLNILLSIRLFLNLFEAFIIFYGFIVFFVDQQNIHCFKSYRNEIIYILIAFNLLSNLSLVLLIWLILFCCFKKSNNSTSTNIIESHQSYNSLLNKYCSICFYDQKSPKLASTFNEMGGLITILMRGNPYDNLELTPSDIITGLHLLRMLQKHYGLFDEKFYFPFNDPNDKDNKSIKYELKNTEKDRLKELEYYTLYANATYGIGLYTLSKPCSICCAPPCGLPHDFDDDILQRNDKCCCESVQIDNSNLKVFIQRTGINVTDLLFVGQIGDLNKVNFYVCIDRKKKSLVISLRGTMSIQDSITDIECNPLHFPEIADDCYVHSGIGKCAKYVFDILITNERIITFLTHNNDYDVVIIGHSLGAGVCCILSLMFKYGDNENIGLFMNDKHKFNAYAIAPPPVFEREFAMRVHDEINELLTCIIYGYDIIPRLSFKGIVITRAAINRLLQECVQTPWWIYEKSITMKYNTIINALKHDTKYCRNYVNVTEEMTDGDIDVGDDRDGDENKYDDKEEDVMPGEDLFMRDVMEDIENMKKVSIEDNLSKPELWNTRFCQSGFVFHAVNAESILDEDGDGRRRLMEEAENVECIKNICGHLWKSVVCGVLRCRMCLDDDNTKYFIYRANGDLFCDNLLISPYLLADHMPQVYLNVLQNTIKNQL